MTHAHARLRDRHHSRDGERPSAGFLGVLLNPSLPPHPQGPLRDPDCLCFLEPYTNGVLRCIVLSESAQRSYVRPCRCGGRCLVPSLPGCVVSSGRGTTRRSFARGWAPGLFPGSGCSVAGRSGHPGPRLWHLLLLPSGCWAWGAGPAAGARSLFKKLPTLVSKASVVVSVLRECQFHVLAAPRRGRSLVLASRSPVARGTSPCVCRTARGVGARLPSAALVLVTYLLTSFVHVFLCRFACLLAYDSVESRLCSGSKSFSR